MRQRSLLWGREALALGREVRLVPPIYVKPFVKRSKNDAADAEAAQRPTMHFVAVKSEAQQAQAMLFHTRDLLVRQRTQTINALRGHLAEYGVVAPQGRARIGQLAGMIEDGDCGLPESVVELGSLLLGRIEELDEKIGGLDRKILTSARECQETARLMTIPGIGPVTVRSYVNALSSGWGAVRERTHIDEEAGHASEVTLRGDVQNLEMYDVVRMADYFGVSCAAMLYRMEGPRLPHRLTPPQTAAPQLAFCSPTPPHSKDPHALRHPHQVREDQRHSRALLPRPSQLGWRTRLYRRPRDEEG